MAKTNGISRGEISSVLIKSAEVDITENRSDFASLQQQWVFGGIRLRESRSEVGSLYLDSVSKVYKMFTFGHLFVY